MTSTAVEKSNPQPVAMPAPQVSDIGTLIQLLAKAVSDPQCDIDKVERIEKMIERRWTGAREDEFNAAMGRAQQKMRPVVKDANNPSTRSKYVSYAALDRAVRPIYSAEGFSLSFNEGDSPKPGHIRVLCYVACCGFTREYHADMPADGKGAKGGDVMTLTHAAGSAFTYGQRYLLKLIFNLATADNDDDGNAAGNADDGPISTEQVQQLEAIVQDVGGKRADELRANTLKYFKCETFADISASEFKRVVVALNKKKAKKS